MKQKVTLGILTVFAILAFCVPGKTQIPYEWEYKAPLHQARAFATAAVVDGKIYVMGGAISRTESTSSIEVYDPETGEWDTTRASLPFPVCAAASVVVDGKIYVIGGKPTYESDTWLNTVFMYNPEQDAYSLSPYTMTTGRAFFSACAVGDEVYAIGGRTEGIFSIATVEKFNLLSGWTSVGDLITARSNFTALPVHDKIYVMAGLDEFGYLPSTVEILDPALGDEWALTSWCFPNGRFLHGSASLGGNIYLYGGVDNAAEPYFDMIKFNPNSFFTTMEGSLPEAKGACASAMVDNSLYAIGGALVPFFMPTVPGPAVSETFLVYGPLSSIESIQTSEELVILSQNQPNPFANSTEIQYELKNPGNVCIRIFSLGGSEVATLWDGYQRTGEHSVTWNAAGVPAGVYVYQLKTDEGVLSRMCVVGNRQDE